MQTKFKKIDQKRYVHFNAEIKIKTVFYKLNNIVLAMI